MLPVETQDPEYPKTTGSRKDNTNLINEWLKNKKVTSSVPCQIMHSTFFINHYTVALIHQKPISSIRFRYQTCS